MAEAYTDYGHTSLDLQRFAETLAQQCNGRPVPLAPTGVEGEYVAGVRYRAWQPPSALHPTIGIHSPLDTLHV